MSFSRHITVAALAAVVLTGLPQAQAAITLTDQNSTLDIDETTSAGIQNWVVDNVDHMNQQWFWLRINSATNVAADTQEYSLDNYVSNVTLTNNDRAKIDYVIPSLMTVSIQFDLIGGATSTGVSNLVELVEFRDNVSGGDIDFSFFQYSDFDLQGSASGDSIFLSNSFAFAQDGTTTFQESLVQSLPLPVRGEAGEASTILGKLTDSNVDDLATDFGAVPFVSNSSATDLAYAWQWDLTLDGVPVIIKNQSLEGEPNNGIGVIPEPSSLLVLSLLGGVFATCRRRV